MSPRIPIATCTHGPLAWLRPLVMSAGLVAAVLPGITEGQDAPIVAAAADLNFALRDIAQSFTKSTGKSVKLTFGSSGNFRRQIAEGAPFELFMSARTSSSSSPLPKRDIPWMKVPSTPSAVSS